MYPNIYFIMIAVLPSLISFQALHQVSDYLFCFLVVNPFLLPNPSLIASQFASELIIHWYKVLQASPFFSFLYVYMEFVKPQWHVSVSRCLASAVFTVQAKWLPLLPELSLLFHMISTTLLYMGAEAQKSFLLKLIDQANP